MFGHRSEAIDKKTRQIKEMISTIRQTNIQAERELSKKLERKIKRQQIFDIRRRHLKQKRQNKKCVLNLFFFFRSISVQWKAILLSLKQKNAYTRSQWLSKLVSNWVKNKQVHRGAPTPIAIKWLTAVSVEHFFKRLYSYSHRL